MGDLPEPRYHTMDKDNTCVMTKVTATLGRNFIRSKEFQEAQQMGLDSSNGGPEENRKGTITLNGVKETNGIVPKDQKDIKEKQRSIRYRASLIREKYFNTII